ncbi:copper chaperone PCu(A)C [Paracoccus sp. DMF-8]|uniref:copper chaperone PCu(A)C n=1 Tax=Paracoccus sp. DMF-8 TaxID=3019445 RepID=UPI0023E7A318|nr:copper chaperone PCu(A)C [Paracoccus sp. DMF-8]MDF3605009.1 copper chaperone PCu(A)C [Paracoccus sp. DMF-8]
MKTRYLAATIAALTLLPGLPALADHDGEHTPHAAHQDAATLGDLTISSAYTRATPPRAPVAGGFVTIANAGADDRLVAAASPIAERVEIHEMAMQDDVMQMRELPDGLPIGAGETVELKPGGLHLMFFGLTGPLTEGETIPVTLSFEKSGEIEIPLTVGPMNARGGHDQKGAH